jgi:hypothetical protein
MGRRTKRQRVAIANLKCNSKKSKIIELDSMDINFEDENFVDSCDEEKFDESFKLFCDSESDDEEEEKEEAYMEHSSEDHLHSLAEEVIKMDDKEEKRWKKNVGGLKGIQKGNGQGRTKYFKDQRDKLNLAKSAVGTKSIKQFFPTVLSGYAKWEKVITQMDIIVKM